MGVRDILCEILVFLVFFVFLVFSSFFDVLYVFFKIKDFKGVTIGWRRPRPKYRIWADRVRAWPGPARAEQGGLAGPASRKAESIDI